MTRKRTSVLAGVAVLAAAGLGTGVAIAAPGRPGRSGSLLYWAPVQSFLAAASLALLGFVVRRRLRGLQSCPVG